MNINSMLIADLRVSILRIYEEEQSEMCCVFTTVFGF